ncbi:MAG: hypothetical protein J5936_05680 [Acholeplasmatales bacterium]|nr:hypothetical protein [Acholeplasmatales bacterium]
MKKLFTAFISITLIAFMLVLVGCGKDIKSINDFSKFSTMKQDADKIEVTYDNGTSTPTIFLIEDDEEISSIMNIIFNSSFEKETKEYDGGNHTLITIYQGSNEYVMNVKSNKDGDYYYSFSNNDLLNKIKELAKTKK